MPKTHVTSKLFIPMLLLSLLAFGFSFDRHLFAKSTGVNAYLVIISGLLITIISLLALKSLADQYPDQPIIRLANKLLGPIGKIGTLVWLVVIFLLTALLTRRVTDVVAAIILFRTPEVVSTLAFIFIAWYLALLGEEALGRVASIFMLMIPMFLFMLVLSFQEVNFLNIHPVNVCRDWGWLKKWDLWPLIFSPVWVLSAFNGNESLRNSFKSVILAITGGAFILAATSLAVAGAFGAGGTLRYEWPVMSLMNITELSSSYFLQNIVTLFYFLIFLPFSLVTVAGFLIVLSKGPAELLGLKNSQSKLVLTLITAALFISLLMTTEINYKETANLVLETGSLYTLGYILLIWLNSLFQRKEKK